ncbi:expressed unknown protein [Seminavis robusta]|uniref:Uncharacterized protein n=1 Tax=Seminavis robusta TaxID=568900 RepID=A0A9N8EXK2_9STRA|nr:expressed unknown protein [Seminavis robusta]|eukprot:Sro2702_g335110.1 n/a (168) ;mRNA; f:5306-5809
MMKLVLFFLFWALGCATAEVYDIAVNYKLAERNGVCSETEETEISEISAAALRAVGLHSAGNSGNWLSAPSNNGNGGNSAEHRNDGKRALGLCDEQILCNNGLLWYCSHCPCCDRRRQLLRVSTERRAGEVEGLASDAAVAEMDTKDRIACLKYPPEVQVNMARKQD